jgi:hypothetical protein
MVRDAGGPMPPELRAGLTGPLGNERPFVFLSHLATSQMHSAVLRAA